MFPFRLLHLPMGPPHVVTLVSHTSSSFLTGYLSFLGRVDSFVSSLAEIATYLQPCLPHTGVRWGNGYMESIPMCRLLLY